MKKSNLEKAKRKVEDLADDQTVIEQDFIVSIDGDWMTNSLQ